MTSTDLTDLTRPTSLSGPAPGRLAALLDPAALPRGGGHAYSAGAGRGPATSTTRVAAIPAAALTATDPPARTVLDHHSALAAADPALAPAVTTGRGVQS